MMRKKRDLAGDIYSEVPASFLYQNHRRFISRTRNRREESGDLYARITEEHSQRESRQSKSNTTKNNV